MQKVEEELVEEQNNFDRSVQLSPDTRSSPFLGPLFSATISTLPSTILTCTDTHLRKNNSFLVSSTHRPLEKRGTSTKSERSQESGRMRNHYSRERVHR